MCLTEGLTFEGREGDVKCAGFFLVGCVIANIRIVECVGTPDIRSSTVIVVSSGLFAELMAGGNEEERPGLSLRRMFVRSFVRLLE